MMNRRNFPLMLLAAWALTAHGDCFQPEPPESRVIFIASQAGAPFEGAFKSFSGSVCLDPADPGAGTIDITIETSAVDTGIPEFDDALRGADFFDTAQWPMARFKSSEIKNIGTDKFSVRGQFTLRNITHEIEVPFVLTKAADGNSQISGETTIQRLDYDIGLGEWRDTRWVGNEVVLRFNVALTPK
jgi:polyisoprenoid-binding protein YceI